MSVGSSPREVYVYGDSHWRVFFPFLNDGEPGACHEQDGIVMLDPFGNGLSGATMWGLRNEGSRTGARRRILADLTERGSVENVALVFGEVDARYHHPNYFYDDGLPRMPRLLETVVRYKSFVEEDLIRSGLVTGLVFIYHGFRYPLGANTDASAHSETENVRVVGTLGSVGFERADRVNQVIESLLPEIMGLGPYEDRIVPIVPGGGVRQLVDSDGVHLRPEWAFELLTFPTIKRALS